MEKRSFLGKILVVIACLLLSSFYLPMMRTVAAAVGYYDYDQGVEYENQSKLDEAIESFKKFISGNPNNQDAHYHLGCCYKKKGERDEAIAAFKKAIAINPLGKTGELAKKEIEGMGEGERIEYSLVKLSEKQIREAIAYGKANRNTPLTEFEKEWMVDLGYGVGVASLCSPFHRLAYRARVLAAQYRELTPAEIDEILGGKEPPAPVVKKKVEEPKIPPGGPMSGPEAPPKKPAVQKEILRRKPPEERGEDLQFYAELYGGSPEFAKNYHAVLETQKKIAQPSSKENRSAYPTMWPGLYRAVCIYEFPTREIDLKSQVTLIIINPQGKELRFPFNLGKMR